MRFTDMIIKAREIQITPRTVNSKLSGGHSRRVIDSDHESFTAKHADAFGAIFNSIGTVRCRFAVACTYKSPY